MRRSWLGLLLLAAHMPIGIASTATATYVPAASLLFKRDETCPANTFRCSEDLGEEFSDICCQNGQTCARDGNDNPACCPSGAVCTGTAPATVATGVPTAAVSYVSNSYFSFPFAPTSYENQQACQSAVRACSANYDACISNLGDGDSYGVTIAVPGGGGTTVAGNGFSLGVSATSVCSSLSSRACSSLEDTDCGDFGSSSVTIYAGLNKHGVLIAFGFATTMLVLLA